MEAWHFAASAPVPNFEGSFPHSASTLDTHALHLRAGAHIIMACVHTRGTRHAAHPRSTPAPHTCTERILELELHAPHPRSTFALHSCAPRPLSTPAFWQSLLLSHTLRVPVHALPPHTPNIPHPHAGADIIMALDDVVPATAADRARFEEATHRTTRWIDRCLAAHSRPRDQNLFAIVQGGDVWVRCGLARGCKVWMHVSVAFHSLAAVLWHSTAFRRVHHRTLHALPHTGLPS
eukprot:366275-Chlamydomonas_euryale.AAC.8